MEQFSNAIHTTEESLRQFKEDSLKENDCRMLLSRLRQQARTLKMVGEKPDEAKLEFLESEFSKLLLSAKVKKNTDLNAKRVALLTSKSANNQSRQDALSGATLVEQSKEATDTLSRTNDLLEVQFGRLSEMTVILKDDSEVLKNVESQYHSYSSTVDMARGLLWNMQIREKSDRILIGIGLGFFLLVVLYILRRRLGPLLSIFSWLIHNLAFYVSKIVQSSHNNTSSISEAL